MIKKYNKEYNEESGEIEIVKNGDLVRLEHIPTRRNLHSHKETAPITKKHYQVTGYGEVRIIPFFVTKLWFILQLILQ